MFIKGGWYVDIGMYCLFFVFKFDKWIDFVVFCEELRFMLFFLWFVVNGVIYVKLGYLVFKCIIDSIVYYCEVNYYGYILFCLIGLIFWGCFLCEEGI